MKMPFTASTQVDLSTAHLQAELARIDLLIQRAVRCWRLAGQNPADDFRGLYVSETDVDRLLARPLGINDGQLAALAPEEARQFAQAEFQADQQVQALVEVAQQQGQVLRLVHLAETFDLDRFDLDTFLICLAPALDLRYERLYGYLQDDVTRKRPSVSLVLDLLDEPGPARLLRLPRFADDAPLFEHDLLERVAESGGGLPHLLGQSLAPDEAIVAWLLGNYQPRADLRVHVDLLRQVIVSETDALLAAEAWPRLEYLLDQRPVIVFYGADQASLQATTRLCAAQLGRPLLAVNMAGVIQSGLAPLHALRMALRDARLTGAIPYLYNWDACLTSWPPCALTRIWSSSPGRRPGSRRALIGNVPCFG